MALHLDRRLGDVLFPILDTMGRIPQPSDALEGWMTLTYDNRAGHK